MRVKHALKQARQADVDCLVLDARGFADAQTLKVAWAAEALLIPSGLAVDDLLPAVRLAHELTRAGVPRVQIGMRSAAPATRRARSRRRHATSVRRATTASRLPGRSGPATAGLMTKAALPPRRAIRRCRPRPGPSRPAPWHSLRRGQA
ncbi:hypothetical protein ACFQU2_17995 [Siccirubricoccus deserti]